MPNGKVPCLCSGLAVLFVQAVRERRRDIGNGNLSDFPTVSGRMEKSELVQRRVCYFRIGKGIYGTWKGQTVRTLVSLSPFRKYYKSLTSIGRRETGTIGGRDEFGKGRDWKRRVPSGRDISMTDEKNVLAEEFETTVRRSGNGGHIMLSKKWVGKRVRITVREIN